jgi:ankyrin repeat protein
MYLSLRAANIDHDDDNGMNVFNILLLKQEIDKCSMLLMRHANINFVNKFGKTPLHLAIENNLDEKTVKFLLN